MILVLFIPLLLIVALCNSDDIDTGMECICNKTPGKYTDCQYCSDRVHELNGD